MNYLFSNAVAWFLSVLFAYVTNRKYVFDSKNNQIIKEAISFFGSRLATGIMDMVLMWFLVNFNIVNDVVAKVVVNFMTQKMIVEFTEGADIKAVMKTVLAECKKVEPDCEIEL